MKRILTYILALGLLAAPAYSQHITNQQLANMAASTIKGRASGAGTGSPQDLTASQVKTILALAFSDLTGSASCSQLPALTGDVTSSSCATTLATLLTASSAGDATHVPAITWDAKGRLTAVTSTAITYPGGMTGFGNPTNPGVNLTGSNGTSVQAMRSDAILALDQSIAPTMTGAWLFKPSSDSTTAVRVQKSDASAVLDLDTTNKRVGVGTESPAVDLDIRRSTPGAAVEARVENSSSAASSTSILEVAGPGTELLDLTVPVSGGPSITATTGTALTLTAISAAVASEPIIFSGASEYGRFDANGRLGINQSSPATTLDVNGAVTFEGAALLSGTVSPSALSSQQDNYAPSGWSATAGELLRLSTTTTVHVTGLASGSAGRLATICNVGTGSHNLVLDNASGSSSAANQFRIAGGDLTLADSYCGVFQYDGTSTYWRAVGLVNAPGTGTVSSVATGNGLQGGAITTTGTVDLRLNSGGGLSKTLGGGSNELGIAANGVTSAMLRQGGALSVIGVTGNATANEADISATAGGAGVLRESGSTIGFGSITEVPVPDGFKAGTAQIRLTLTSGTPVTTSDVTAATTLYATPYLGSWLGLYYSSAWHLYSVTEKSIKLTDSSQTGTMTSGTKVITGLTDTSQLVRGMQITGTSVGASSTIASIDSATQVTGTVNSTGSTTNSVTFKLPASTNYDVFAVPTSSSAYRIQLGPAWTNDSTRATAVTQANAQDGILVNDTAINGTDSNTIGAKGGRYLGTIRTISTAGQTDDAAAFRLVWNMYNRARRPILEYDSTTSWSYNTATWRQARASTANEIDLIVGQAYSAVDLTAESNLSDSTANAFGDVGIGEDSTTAVSANCSAGLGLTGGTTAQIRITARLASQPAAGFHFYAWLEKGNATGTLNWFSGDATDRRSGLTGTWEN